MILLGKNLFHKLLFPIYCTILPRNKINLLLVLYFSLWAALFSDIHQGEKPYEQVTARVYPVIKTSLSYYGSKSPFVMINLQIQSPKLDYFQK